MVAPEPRRRRAVGAGSRGGRAVPDHLRRFVRDLGFGDGRLSAELMADQLTIADVSPVALARARSRLPRATALELALDAPLPLPDSSHDLVLCAETLEHVRDVQLALSEARRRGSLLAVGRR
jgi:ubiquinone/menaquinone biosynthesis C-methylase UbiE